VNELVFDAALFARLQGDSTLRTLLSHTTAEPYGVYRSLHKRTRQDMPFLVVQFLPAGIVDDESEHTTVQVQVSAFGGDQAAVQARVRYLFDVVRAPITATDLHMESFQYVMKGPELFDQALLCHYRPDTYLVRYSLSKARLS
jgi:hypothetical protein